MNDTFVQLDGMKKLLAAISRLEGRGASEASWVLVFGDPGLGKTRTCKRLAVQYALPYVRAQSYWTTPLSILNDLLKAFNANFPERRRTRDAAQDVQKWVQQEADKARREGRIFALMIDEADYCMHRDIIETLRDITDATHVPLICVCMTTDRQRLARYRQVLSRVATEVEFKPLSLDDTKSLVEGLSTVPVDEKLVTHLHRATGGFAREMMGCISTVEKEGRKLNRTVSLQDMVGKPLFHDRRTGHPYVVQPHEAA